jgi:MFS family permease
MAEFSTPMTREEKRSTAALAGIFALRMLGLFMILPVFALYAQQLTGTTPFLVGVAIGVYGLTQSVFQIPFGMASDRLGRKPVIAFGLVVFALGSVVAALSTSIYGVILGRAMQGSGAVAAAAMALAADLTREEHRTKTLAFIGMTIGMSFLVAMVLGPVLNHFIGVPGIFWFIAVLAILGIAVLYTLVPHPKNEHMHRDVEPVPAQFNRVLKDPELLRINFGIFALHLVLTASFVVIPLALRDAGLEPSHHGYVYLPVMLLGMAFAVPFIILGEKKRMMKQVVTGAVAVLALAELGYAEWHETLVPLALSMGLFFVAFNLLEATMPSLIAKVAPPESKGTAMGFYSSSQFLGAFVGGAAGGWLFGHHGIAAVFLFSALVLALWLAFAATMAQPRYLATHLLNVGPVDTVRAGELTAALAAVPGVAEVVVNQEEGVAYLRVDSGAVDVDALNRFSVPAAEGA